MKIRLEAILFMSFSLCLSVLSFPVNSQENKISDADEEWTYDIESIDPVMFNSSNSVLNFFNQALVYRADEVSDVNLESVDLGGNPYIDDRTPVLFVPGLLGTKIKDGEGNFLWVDLDRMINPLRPDSYSDGFMDALSFGNDLLPIDDDLLLGSVLKKETYVGQTTNYTQGLIDEFASKGYVEGKDFFTFPYDWRYGVSGEYPHDLSCVATTTNATLLRDKINELAAISPTGKVDVIAHSMGGLITKKYIIDNDNPKINKLVFVGVPSLGAPRSLQALLDGTDFGIFGLNSQELKKVSQNMPAAYDLLPTKGYYTKKGSYLMVGMPNALEPGDAKILNYEEVLSYLKNNGFSNLGVTRANDLHSVNFDYFDMRPKGIDLYNIVGCQSNTFRGIIDYQKADDTGRAEYGNAQEPLSGDDTVPFESANSVLVDDSQRFYFRKAAHGKMPSADGIRQKIINIITGEEYTDYPGMITYGQLYDNQKLCELTGDHIIVKSPVDIYVTDQNGNIVLGIDNDGNTHYEIPGASFKVMGGHKYVYLPSDMDNQFKINLKGTGEGSFTLVDQRIEGGKATSTQVFNDILVTPDFSGSLEIIPKIITSNGQQINVTSQIQGNAANDILSPQTELLINGNTAKEIYNSTTTINLVAKDFAQEGISAAGVFSISYRLDNQVTTTIAATTTALAVFSEGLHQLLFFATDKLGNKETPKTINFTIDKTPPELKFNFDQAKKDLVFSATDNISLPGKVIITDQGGIVTATDEAGNTVQLKFKETNRKSALRAQLATITYNGKSVDISGSQLALAWFYGYVPKTQSLTGLQSLPSIPKTLPNSGSLSFLLQQAKFQNGSFIVALYTAGKTTILEYKDKHFNLTKVPGLKIVTFGTREGKVGWGW